LKAWLLVVWLESSVFFPSLSWFRPFLEIVFLYGLLAGLVFDLVLGSYFFQEVQSFGWTW
jgi:hypothetical protein